MLQHHEKKIITLTACALTALCLFVFLLIIPTIRGISRANSLIFQIQHDLELRYERTTNLRKSKVNLGRVRQSAAELQKLFVAPNHELDFIVFLENSARTRRLEQSITLTGKQQVKQAGLIAITTQIQATGAYQDVLSYLTDIEQADLAIHLNSITLAQGGPPNTIGKITPSAGTATFVTLSAQATAYVNP